MAAAKDKTQTKHETVFISEADQYIFGQGTHYDIYKKLGAHLSNEAWRECTSGFGRLTRQG